MSGKQDYVNMATVLNWYVKKKKFPLLEERKKEGAGETEKNYLRLRVISLKDILSYLKKKEGFAAYLVNIKFMLNLSFSRC